MSLITSKNTDSGLVKSKEFIDRRSGFYSIKERKGETSLGMHWNNDYSRSIGDKKRRKVL